jgi:RES domain-containing protein
VPSVVVPAEYHLLINPAHPRFADVVIGRPETLAFDLRLLR